MSTKETNLIENFKKEKNQVENLIKNEYKIK